MNGVFYYIMQELSLDSLWTVSRVAPGPSEECLSISDFLRNKKYSSGNTTGHIVHSVTRLLKEINGNCVCLKLY